MSRKIAIISGKGGVGKTTTALNLGTALAKLGRDVVLVDANLETPDLGLYLGVPEVKTTLNDVLQGRKHISQATYKHAAGMKVVLSDISFRKGSSEYKRLNKALLDMIKTEFVIIDAAPGIASTRNVVRAADEVIIVTNPELPAVTNALKMLKMAKEENKNVSIVLNRAHDKADMSEKKIEELLQSPLLAVIPEDTIMIDAVRKKQPVVHLNPRAKSSRQFINLAKQLTGEEEAGFFLRIKQLFGKKK